MFRKKHLQELPACVPAHLSLIMKIGGQTPEYNQEIPRSLHIDTQDNSLQLHAFQIGRIESPKASNSNQVRCLPTLRMDKADCMITFLNASRMTRIQSFSCISDSMFRQISHGLHGRCGSSIPRWHTSLVYGNVQLMCFPLIL